jgi:hypothetical protein
MRPGAQLLAGTVYQAETCSAGSEDYACVGAGLWICSRGNQD